MPLEPAALARRHAVPATGAEDFHAATGRLRSIGPAFVVLVSETPGDV